ncbi:MAG: hypothetical protein ABJA62_10720, partial [Luteimonas sp.]
MLAVIAVIFVLAVVTVWMRRSGSASDTVRNDAASVSATPVSTSTAAIESSARTRRAQIPMNAADMREQMKR